MKDNEKNRMLTGVILVGVGLVLLATLLNWLNALTVYNTAVPILLIIFGFAVVSAPSATRQNVSLGIGALLVGVVGLLARFDLLGDKIANGVLGFILLIGGLVYLTHFAEKHSK
ncbi:hypothetical protein KBB49_03240 [Candidatus Saccharibacteria bacterium]|nr:hypothetical protein [Candidatus Saccharibacteria bacterium]